MKHLKALTITAILIAALFSGCKKDDDPGLSPTVLGTDPISNATNKAVNTKITATFSVAMLPASINNFTFTLQQGTTSVAGTISYSGTTASFMPTVNLTSNTVYTATITTGATDLLGKSLAKNYTWNFTSSSKSDLVPPSVTLTDPANAATGVALGKVVLVTFTEPMDVATITPFTVALRQGTTSVASTVTLAGAVATVTPTSSLLASTVYTVTITTGVKDVAGNPLATERTFSFTTSPSGSNLAVVSLGAAGNYVILAKTAINNISTSAITGDLGLSPAATSYITGLSITNATGYATSAQVTGKIFAADMADPTPINLTTAVENMITAYNDAAGRPSPDFSELGTGNIGGLTLTKGLYKWTNTVTIPSSVTVSGGANDVWIFQIAQNLTMSNSVNVTLIGGAQAKNIIWQVAGTVTIGTGSHIEGVILSKTGITFQTGASITGRALAQTAVVLDGNAVTKPQ